MAEIEIPQQADALARAKGGERLAIVGRHGKTQLLVNLACNLPNSVLVRVPSGADQLPYVVLQAASQCGTVELRAVADALSKSVSAGVASLRAALNGRPLLVDDADAIGIRGVDHELRDTFYESIREVRAFVESTARVVTMTAERQSSAARQLIEPEPRTANGHAALLVKMGLDLDAFALALLREKLVASDSTDLAWDVEEIVGDVWAALPDSFQGVVRVLAVHGRPIETEALDSLHVLRAADIRAAVEQGVVIEERGMLRLPKPWYRYLALPRAAVRGTQMQLAKAFAGEALGSKAHLERPLSVLEAHRHFADAGDVDRAREFAHFGAATLLAFAKRVSIAGRYDTRRYAEAAKTYDVVLELERSVSARGGTLGDRVVGYARHYRHYNRYKADLESRVETIDGYVKALDDWPGNALFRSRMIVAYFVDDRYAEAKKAIDEAYVCVKHHPHRDQVLRGRTTERLLERRLVEAALLAWSDHHSDAWTSPIEQRLAADLDRGLESARLRDFHQSVVLFEPVHVRFSRAGKTWMAHALDTVGRGAVPASAYSALISSLRTETQRLHQTLTHQLTPSDRMAKQRLLGMVDLAASELLELGPGETWVYGRLEDQEGALAFVTHQGHRFDVDIAALAQVTGESSYRLARVKTGPAGQAIGPVLELDVPLGGDSALAFARWRARIAGNG